MQKKIVKGLMIRNKQKHTLKALDMIGNYSKYINWSIKFLGSEQRGELLII